MGGSGAKRASADAIAGGMSVGPRRRRVNTFAGSCVQRCGGASYDAVVTVIAGIGGVLIVLAAAWLVLVAVLWLHRPSRDLVAPTIRLVPDLVRLVRGLLRDSTTPRSVKLVLGGLLVYLLNPIDLIPDFLPVVGPLDDIILAAIALRWAGRRIGEAGLRDHWVGTEAGFGLLRRLLGL